MDVFSGMGGIEAGRHDVLSRDENSLATLSSGSAYGSQPPVSA